MSEGTRVMLGVRGLTENEDRERVRQALLEVPGVLSVRAAEGEGDTGPVEVQYDDRRTTVMEMIRALRRLGYLAGME